MFPGFWVVYGCVLLMLAVFKAFSCCAFVFLNYFRLRLVLVVRGVVRVVYLCLFCCVWFD